MSSGKGLVTALAMIHELEKTYVSMAIMQRFVILFDAWTGSIPSWPFH